MRQAQCFETYFVSNFMGNFSMDFLEKVSRSVDVSYWLLLVVRLKASPAKQWCGGSFICTVCFIVFPERSAKDQTSIKEWSMWAWRSVLATDGVADLTDDLPPTDKVRSLRVAGQVYDRPVPKRHDKG